MTSPLAQPLTQIADPQTFAESLRSFAGFMRSGFDPASDIDMAARKFEAAAVEVDILTAQAALSAEEKATTATVGEAGYPGTDEVVNRLPTGYLYDNQHSRNIIRASIDWERERVAKVAGGVTDEQAKHAIGSILAPFLDMGTHGAPDWAIVLAHALEHPERHGLPGETATQGFGPGIWQCKWSPANELHGDWAHCSKEWRDEYANNPNWQFRALAVRQPVPAEVLEAAERLTKPNIGWYTSLPAVNAAVVSGCADATLILDWLRKVSA
jgi:hypothetical protein